MKEKKTLTREQILTIPALFEAGKSRIEVAQELGVSEITVHRWAKRLKQAGYTLAKQKQGRKPTNL
jgi:transposase